MNVVDSLMDLVRGRKQEDGAAAARANLQQTWGYPSLVAALPYRYYDEANELFVNAGTAGFILEAAPLPGANEQVIAALDDMLRKKLPRKTPVSVILLASKCVGERISRGVSTDMWKGEMADHLNKITRAFWERSALKGLANEREYPLYLRNYRIFIVYGKPAKRFTQQIMDDLVQVRNTIRVSLSAARIDSMNTDVNAFLSAMREMLNYRQDQVMTSSGEYNEDEKLNRQVVDPSIDVRVRPSHIRLELPESIDAGGTRLPASTCRVINMQLNKNPRRFALWQGADNLQNLRFPDLGIPCPFMLTWTTELEEQTATQNEALRKDMDLSKKAASAYGQLFPGTKRAADEWRRNREQLSSNEIAFCRTYLNLTLFTPDNNTDAQACELAAVNVFRKNDLEMVTVQYQQMRNWLACFPFMMQEGMWEDLKMTGATLRCKSWNAVNLMPVVAERQLSHVGMPLPTYRNQVAFFDMFGEENGSTNFNIAVTGTSGAGKSFLTQGILRDVLNAGGFAWVIDMGDSYKNYCQQAGGVYLDGAKLRFNPFANVKDIKHSAEGIVRLLTVLASPTEPLDGVCEAILQKAVMDAWEKKQQGARIDDVHNYLTHPDVNGAFADKPTIISRLAELAMLLETYCTWGPDGEYFNADNPTLDGETRFAVLELLSLEDKPKLLSSILFSLILAIQEKMYHSPRDLKKVCIIDEAWRLLGGSNPHAARFIETGYRTVRRHRGSFITITQGIKDFSASKEAEAAWNNSSTKITLLQDARAFKQYLSDNPDQFSDMEKEVIRGFQPALQTGYSSLLISAGEFSSFHRLFVDPITRAMFSSRGEDFAYMQNAQKAGATSEEAAYLLAEKKFGDELRELEEWVKAA
ncbi:MULTISPECIES: type IV secretion system protein TraC [Enterobacteriaceae]|jgi:conjugal transfer ATP-binding protein TraC|uniref:IncF plasmid conjugative transfer pilus assembly protein TraC n=2 Tax=Leclercia adecarboxylata TaxID=83655 RepID=A0A482M1H6_9ENTR|nr:MULTISPECIES: type IV secretion system protein TraC [Enterobacteriaceae]ELW9465963.1 type IV secretion system protein TraC [Enterobacter hormaechei]MCW4705989.1 type IV secretion system protein TraC [Enterobacter kobei]MDV5463895.1 type IV secretion system protein TraC [Leclercia adecarboxylata]MDV5505772.1 type IV secretion system protein TraC [Leclercia adecarboxylata]MDV5565294.1 type IV secretion system protein TraC [Leclercia adecarboxylata]